MCSDTDKKQLAASAALTTAARRWRYVRRQCLSSLPLAEAGAEPLMLLKKLAEPVHQSTLAQMASLKGPSLSRLIDQLALAGLVKRLSYPGDRRANSVLLTEKGFEVADAAEVRLAELRSRALANISDNELDITIKVLQAFFNAERRRV